MKPKNQHVVPRPNGWAVKPETNQRATSIHRTQSQAIDAARRLIGTGETGHEPP